MVDPERIISLKVLLLQFPPFLTQYTGDYHNFVDFFHLTAHEGGSPREREAGEGNTQQGKIRFFLGNRHHHKFVRSRNASCGKLD